MRDLLKEIIPPILFSIYRKIKGDKFERAKKTLSVFNVWSGNYSSWEKAINDSKGYDDELILERCKESLLKVKRGQAAYERDSVVFDKIQYAWPLLACLENIAIENNLCLHLIDFGGSLGSSYYQNRHFLKSLQSFKWIVVEQDHFVECGKQEFKDENLDFNYTIEETIQMGEINCLLLSSVLPYLSNPLEWIEKFCNYGFDNIIVDRTSFTSARDHFLTVQQVPAEIYQASYPCWFFNEASLIAKFSEKYELFTDFNDSFTPPVTVNNHHCYWKGFYFKKKKYE